MDDFSFDTLASFFYQACLGFILKALIVLLVLLAVASEMLF